MFGFSITKLLFTLVAIIVVWKGFKWYNRLQENRSAPVRGDQGSAGQGAEAAGPSDAEEMVKCAVCETFVSSASAVSCGKDGCPYPG